MSISAQNWAYAQAITPSGRKFVLVAICNFADAEGRAFMSVGTLASMTGQDEKSVRRHMDALEETGFIRREERFRRDGSRTTNDVFVLAPADVLVPASPASAARRPGKTPPGQIVRGSSQDVRGTLPDCPGVIL